MATPNRPIVTNWQLRQTVTPQHMNDIGLNLQQIFTADDSNVKITGSQTIGGTKTFEIAPICSASPQSNASLVNKSYVDQREMKFSTLPVKSTISNNDYIMISDSTSGWTSSKVSYSSLTNTLNGQYVPLSRTINSKALSSNITLSAADIGAVPTSRTINSKPLSANVTLAAADVGAVPTTRTVNGKALSANITLSADDVNAARKSAVVPVTLGTGWSGSAAPYTLTVSVSGVSTSTSGTLDVANTVNLQQLQQFELAGIVIYSQSTNSVTLRALRSKPTVSIPVHFLLVG